MTLRVLTDVFSDLHNDFTYRGQWNIGTAYTMGDFVVYNDILYVAKTDVDHSATASTLLYHDDFHRADTVDGWGTSTEGITWITDFEQDGPGSLVISNNEGVSNSAGVFSENITTYPITSLSTRNIDILWRFYTTYSGTYSSSFFFLSGEDETGSQAYLAINNVTSGFKYLTLITTDAGSYSSKEDEYEPSLLPLTTNTDYFLLIRCYGNFYGAKLWKASLTIPDNWSVSLTSDKDMSANDMIILDTYPLSGSGSLRVKDVKVYGLPSVSPDLMPGEWLSLG